MQTVTEQKWSQQLKSHFPFTRLAEGDVPAWEAEILEMVPDVKPGETSQAIIWASYAGKDKDNRGQPVGATPQDLVGWIRSRRFEIREAKHGALPEISNEQRNAANEACAQVIRTWLERKGNKGYEAGYMRVLPDDKIEPTDEFWSTSGNEWRRVGEHCARYKHMRRKRG